MLRRNSLPVLALAASVVLAACGSGTGPSGQPGTGTAGPTATGTSGASTDTPPAEAEFPRLVDISVDADDSHSRVVLSFAPGRGVPTASVDESDDPVLPRPDTGGNIELAGEQALAVSIAPAIAPDVVVGEPRGPAIAEVRVLGFAEGRTSVGIGVNGVGALRPRVSKPDENTIRIAVSNPPYPAEDPRTRQCGDVGFEPQTDYGAFDIEATGVGCAVARDVAAFAEGEIGEPYGTPSGFSCLPERDESGPMTTVVYTCTRDDATITFVA